MTSELGRRALSVDSEELAYVKEPRIAGFFRGGDEETRTPDPLHAKQEEGQEAEVKGVETVILTPG